MSLLPFLSPLKRAFQAVYSRMTPLQNIFQIKPVIKVTTAGLHSSVSHPILYIPTDNLGESL